MRAAAIRPTAARAHEALLQNVALRYGIDPSPNAIADLGEGDHAEVRGGIMPLDARALLGERLPAEPGEPVAVKIPYPGLGAPLARAMVAHEAEASERLEAAGGGELFARAVRDPDFRVLVMEDLRAYRPALEWAEGRRVIAPRTFARIQTQLERGLAALEAAGLVHSDLKPDNVLIGPRARVKIVDPGIAAEEGGYPPYPGYDGWRGGHVDYVSENQLRNGPAAFADDRHSVGVLLGRLRRFVR
ncbi:MAG TPA: protein kinase [Elusimicrobiota bacterium]|nr:protein kinase [Elusimicrobiota bacterium]